MCDCAEELERRRRGPPIPPSSASSASSGKGWLPVLGGATLLAIIALLYKSWDKVKALVWRADTCGEIIKKRKPEPEKINLCICKD